MQVVLTEGIDYYLCFTADDEDGSFDVLPRQRGFNFVTWHPLRLVIHSPIYPEASGPEEVKRVMQTSYDIIMKDLPEEYQGMVENPDQ